MLLSESLDRRGKLQKPCLIFKDDAPNRSEDSNIIYIPFAVELEEIQRNWPTRYSLGQNNKSRISTSFAKTLKGIMVLPKYTSSATTTVQTM